MRIKPTIAPRSPRYSRAARAAYAAAMHRDSDTAQDFAAVLLANEHNRQSFASLLETWRSMNEGEEQ